MSSLTSKKDYTRYYGDFRGVDFSSEHTQVHERRLAYLVNMYKDYRSGQGNAIETIPGFRRRLDLSSSCRGTVYAMHEYKRFDGSVCVLVHIGKKLYIWDDIRDDVIENEATSLRDDMNETKSSSFIMNNKLYLIDGKSYLVYDGESIKDATEGAYIPTTYINIIAAGENADAGKQKEQRNLLSPYFINTFIPDGVNGEFKLNEKELDDDNVIVKVYGVTKTKGDHYTVDKDNGTVTFKEGHIPPVNPAFIENVDGETSEINTSSNESDITNAGEFPRDYAGVEIQAKKARDSSVITNCSLLAVFDERVFFSGNPDCPNRVIFSALNDPTYIPEISFINDGSGYAPVTGMLAVADTLMVLKSDTQQDGAVYFHTAEATGDDLYPKTYPSTRGLAGIGCLGACTNFLDDPVFVSRLGVEAVGQLSVRYERAIEHRSSLIDAKLLNLGRDKLEKASITEWNGYLILLVDGKIFMADSRQKYTHDVGVTQYEWYYLEDIGIYEGQYLAYRYAKYIEGDIEVELNGEKYTVKLAPEELRGALVNAPKDDGTESAMVYDNGNGVFYVIEGSKAYLCNTYGEMVGGTYVAASIVQVIGDNLFFGTKNGIICSFNFDKYNEYGEIPATEYTFNGRTIFSGCATKMDNCDIPHLTKSTVKKSTVIKTRSMMVSAAKVMVRTNLKPYEQIARINSTVFSFEDINFEDFSFITLDQSLFSIKEKEKKWVEKQYYIFSDEFRRPFSLHYVTFSYNIAGKYKE